MIPEFWGSYLRILEIIVFFLAIAGSVIIIFIYRRIVIASIILYGFVFVPISTRYQLIHIWLGDEL